MADVTSDTEDSVRLSSIGDGGGCGGGGGGGSGQAVLLVDPAEEEEDSDNTRERHDTGVVDVNDGVRADTADAVGDSRRLVRSVGAREYVVVVPSVWWAAARISIGSSLV